MRRLRSALLSAALLGSLVVAAPPAQASVGAACSGSKLRSTAIYADNSYNPLYMGRVELWYSGGRNCVQVITDRPGWKHQYLWAWLYVGTTNKPSTAKIANYDFDAGSYEHYAGGVWLPASNRCVQYRGQIRFDVTTDGSEFFVGYYRSPWTACS